MIHILLGGDTKNKSIYTKGLTVNYENFFVKDEAINKELIMSYCYSIDLFGKALAVIVENILNSQDINFSSTELNSLKESKTLFVFKEDKLSQVLQNKYKKYSEIKNFEDKKVVSIQKSNIFGITDAFAKRDKVATWSLYHKGILAGLEPEAIAGVLFWKIKTMILSSSGIFNKNELKNQSSSIISLYHKAHKGECDLTIGLEQFILTSLSSK